MLKFAVLVYQAGIANVFQVDCDYGKGPNQKRNAKRLIQGDFRTCENFCRGLVAAGVVVRSCHCNMAGDVAEQPWDADLGNAPFRDQMRPVKGNFDGYKNEALSYFLSVMDGCKGWHEIHEHTGLPQADCEAIYKFYCDNVK